MEFTPEIVQIYQCFQRSYFFNANVALQSIHRSAFNNSILTASLDNIFHDVLRDMNSNFPGHLSVPPPTVPNFRRGPIKVINIDSDSEEEHSTEDETRARAIKVKSSSKRLRPEIDRSAPGPSRKVARTVESAPKVLAKQRSTFKYESEKIESGRDYNSAILVRVKCMDEKCQQDFSTRDLMNQHYIKIHKMSPFKCLIKDCDRAYNSKYVSHYFNYSSHN